MLLLLLYAARSSFLTLFFSSLYYLETIWFVMTAFVLVGLCEYGALD